MINIYQKTKNILGLSFSLARANFKLRNEGSYLGIFWYLLEPLSFLAILLFIRGSILQDKIEYYPIYLFIGLIMFNFFTAVTNFSTKVMQNNSGFIKSLKINKESFVISGLLQFVFSHIFEFTILFSLVLFFRVNPFWLFFYPVFFLFFCFFTLGVSFILSVLGVYIIDLKNIWAVFTRLLWFATPIFYTIQNGGLLKKIMIFNPIYHFINISRDVVIFHKISNVFIIFIIVVFSLLVFLIGLFIFEKNKSKLAEKI
jgi:ABC-type polysaccharide/polyol phosphate export permease